ncbi:cytochrome P450 family protein [Rhizoctonia solani]|uniref:Cytochrome P450 family protein n=1 Tax=Rhizoctonia solani TaxID=456999 RepID=A0A8H8T157_9AGAM|nr:cytochrome P450 family protein [Rhizoctonia solani]QRW26096.1 cytochrome P450 family protein [Rhizoctonia solani]
MISLITAVASGCIIVWLIDLRMKFRKEIARIGHVPTLRLLFPPQSILGFIIPPIPFISSGPNHGFRLKRELFDKFGMDIYAGVGIIPTTSAYFVSDAEALKQILASRGAFQKHNDDYQFLTIFGRNLIVSEGEEWRRQRKIVAPVFSDKNNRLVQVSAKGFVDQMTSTWSRDQPTRIQDIDGQVTMQITLCVISKAGFGQDIEWWNDGEAPEGHKFTFKQALFTVSKNLPLIIVMPKWMFGWTKHWVHVRDAYQEMRLYFQEMISSRRADNTPGSQAQAEEQHDLFNQLLLAHDDSSKLSEEELLGNVFLFLFAGHETTAHSLAFTLALLSVYPEEQRKVIEEIEWLQKERDDFGYEDLPKYTYTQAVWYETLRLYPIGPELPRRAGFDTSLTYIPHDSKQPTTISIKNGSQVIINIPGLHYNPNYWDDPTDFIPARFLEPNWNKDAFIPFLAGPRACIGRRSGVPSVRGNHGAHCPREAFV